MAFCPHLFRVLPANRDKIMDHMEFAIVGVALFAFLTISAVAGTVAAYKKRSLELEVLRTALEHGQPLDPALLEHLTIRHGLHPEWGTQSESPTASSAQPLELRIGGIVTIGSGIGVAVLACFLIPVVPSWFYPIAGVGAVAVCVGISLLICSRTIERRQDAPANHEADA